MKVEPAVADFFAAGRSAAESTDVGELHSFRIAVKRLRYRIEILDPDGGREWLKRLRRLQDELGEMNDATVAAEFLLSVPSLSKAGVRVEANLRADAQAQIAAFRKTWRRSFGERSEQAWLEWARSLDG